MKLIALSVLVALATLALGACKHRRQACCGPKNPSVYTAAPCYPPAPAYGK